MACGQLGTMPQHTLFKSHHISLQVQFIDVWKQHWKFYEIYFRMNNIHLYEGFSLFNICNIISIQRDIINLFMIQMVWLVCQPFSWNPQPGGRTALYMLPVIKIGGSNYGWQKNPLLTSSSIGNI